jgi:hypothetical protein
MNDLLRSAPAWRGPIFVYLLGYPGVGKYTIAQELARLGSASHHHVVVDNHYVNNVIFPLVDADGVKPLGPEVWAKVAEVRRTVLNTIETVSPPEWSFIFTNVLEADEPADRELYEVVRALAARRQSHFVPVVLSCSIDELARRVVAPVRARRLKWTDANRLRGLVATRKLLAVEDPNGLELDITEQSVAETAEMIADHLAHVTQSRPTGTVLPDAERL